MTANPLLNPAGDFTPDVWKLLYKAANRYAAGAVDRDDLIQEAAVNLLKYGPGYDPRRATLGTFVYAMVRYTRGRLLRAALRVRVPDRLTADPPGRQLPGDDDHDRAARLAELRRAVDRLPADGRVLVERRFGLGGGEPVMLKVLAAERGVTTQAVGDRLNRVVRRLAVELRAG